MKKKIFVITGELSGDILASKIIDCIDLKKIDIKGIVGSNLKDKGIDGPFESKDITFFGITDVIKNIFYIKKKINQTVTYIETFKPDIVFSVDSPDFVFQVIKKIKKREKIRTKFFHFVAPSIWAWRERRGYMIAKLIDKIYLLFKFEKKFFDKYSINNDYVGHPFFENFKISNYDLSVEKKIISFCPGSRKKEIHTFMPIFLDIIKNYNNQFKYHFAVTRETVDIVNEYLAKLKDVIFFVNVDEKSKIEYFKKSIITIAKSGTITLDLCQLQVPFITIYKLSWINYLIIKPFVKVKYVNIINIISNKQIVPEFIQRNCNSKKIIFKLDEFFKNKHKLKELVDDYGFILNELSNKNTSKHIADDIVQNLK
tara:strand:- start:238 stop:1347 length:1110 start_codon:yes stop_codon:yes gene_type:complete